MTTEWMWDKDGRPHFMIHNDANLYNKTNIVDLNVIVPNKVIEVIFEDGTKEKAVCQDPDTFKIGRAHV